MRWTVAHEQYQVPLRVFLDRRVRNDVPNNRDTCKIPVLEPDSSTLLMMKIWEHQLMTAVCS